MDEPLEAHTNFARAGGFGEWGKMIRNIHAARGALHLRKYPALRHHPLLSQTIFAESADRDRVADFRMGHAPLRPDTPGPPDSRGRPSLMDQGLGTSAISAFVAFYGS
jgi:hypothetical protein